MRGLTVPCLFIVLACSPGGGGGSSGGSSGGPGGTTSGTTGSGSSGGEQPTSGGSAEASTSAPGTTMVDPSTTSGTSAAETTGTSTGEPGTTGASTTTGEPAGPECEVDEDCALRSDCCACEGVPVGEEPEVCDEECKQPLCSEFGVEAAVCRLGVCQAERLSCDQFKVLCDADPPRCPAGMLPETSPNCWTGKCVPSELCDVVLGCLDCGPGQFCVTKQGEGVFPTVCEPLPGACGGTSSCNCVGELVCLEPFGQCFQQDVLAVSCECPNC